VYGGRDKNGADGHCVARLEDKSGLEYSLNIYYDYEESRVIDNTSNLLQFEIVI